MKKSDLNKNYDRCERSIAKMRRLANKFLAAQRVVNGPEVRSHLMEGILTGMCARWEVFAAKHMVDCINLQPARLSEYYGVELPDHPSRAVCQVLFRLEAKSLSPDEVVGKAKSLLPDEQNPFAHIDAKTRDTLRDAWCMRNYIMHYSHAAKRQLMKRYKDQHGMQKFKSPGVFLAEDGGKRMLGLLDAFEAAISQMRTGRQKARASDGVRLKRAA